MDLRELRFLVEIVNCGGFGKAAEVVHLSQPALSKAIRGLEEELDETLLERGYRGSKVRLTPAGEVVYRHAVELLSRREQMLHELHALRGLETGELNIGLSPLGSAEIFAPIIARFRATYPEIEIHLRERGGVEQEDALRNGEVELATSLVPTDADVDWLQICDDPMMLTLPQAHPLAEKKAIRLEDLNGVSIIGFDSSFQLSKLIGDTCRNKGFEPDIAAEVTHPDFGLALVAAGTGVMLLPRLIAERHVTEGVVVRPLESSSLRWSLSLIWRRRASLSFAARAMREMIRETLL
ncbi:LysR substrate-binding domain-containing protein [Marinobacterium mangrovicola]|uniref:LysR family transcriptional regulator n=1 Tax=Marinobacterium mangrovicola TaxID=1476959 RepID=A0A4R1GC33_9GAMM|nr:LysR substrate-binding domain-containing protein [Marinobacterium mangrovicola]TCK04075.1 LysR family transcriptional regulator [Marinobacterium mangrovicola]